MAIVTPHQVAPGVLCLRVLPTLTPARLPTGFKHGIGLHLPAESAPKPPYLEFNVRKQISVDMTPQVLCPPEQREHSASASSPRGGGQV